MQQEMIDLNNRLWDVNDSHVANVSANVAGQVKAPAAPVMVRERERETFCFCLQDPESRIRSLRKHTSSFTAKKKN